MSNELSHAGELTTSISMSGSTRDTFLLKSDAENAGCSPEGRNLNTKLPDALAVLWGR